MKKLLSFLTLLLVSQLVWSQNQIVTTITPKVSFFPSTGLSYMDDPAKYFTIQMFNTSGTPMEVFFTIELTADFTATNQNYYVRTKKEIQPSQGLMVGMTPVLINRPIFDQMIGHLNASAYETNYDLNNLASDLLVLPEGQYRFCITPYLWTGKPTPNPTQVGEQTCITFSICYTGSAPEFTTPVNGLSASNLNNSNPTNNLLNPVRPELPTSTVGRKPLPLDGTPALDGPRRLGGITSDNRQSDVYMRIPLSRQLIFNWTGVISNCLAVNDFDYILKIVEVQANQNVQEAIDRNGTLCTYNNKSKTVYIHDTVANRQFRLIPGHVYAAQVQAVLKKTLMTEVQLSNGGKSQIITFVWGENEPIVQAENTSSHLKSVVSDNHEQVLEQIQNPYFVNPGQDKPLMDKLKSSGKSQAPMAHTGSTFPYVTDVDAGDSPYYQVPVSDTIGAQWMPVCGDSVIKVVYTTELYEYNGGAVSNAMIGLPLKTASVTVQSPHSFSPKGSQLMGVPTDGWTDVMEEGYKYVLHLKAETYYSYQKKTTYTITEYIHNIPKDRDSVVTSVAFASSDLYSDVVFAWGVDSGTMDKVTPPQFTYPVDLTEKDLDDNSWDLPEVAKRKDFSFRWKAAGGVNYGDSVYYSLRVAKLPKGKKPEQVKDTLFFKDHIAATTYIDTALFDSLKTGGQYVAVLETHIKQLTDTSNHYQMLHKGQSHIAAFKLVEPPAFQADLNNKIKCSPQALKDLSKDLITPKADSLAQHRVKLKMGEFPLVVQQAVYDTAKKAYNGNGYVIWHPLGVDVRLKVQFDSIQINKNYEIVNGSAISIATDSSTYFEALKNDLEMEKWTNDDINNIVSQLGENETIKGYYDKFEKYGEKYSKKYGGLLGPIVGENMATEVMTFPLSVTDKEITGSENVIFAINNMYFSPVTALMNIWAIFAAQDDDAYVPFLANNICMDQQGLLGKSDQHIDLFMGRNYEFDIKDGYKMRFKASSNFADPKDGTVISIDSGKLNHVTAEIQMDFDNNDLIGIEKDGTPRKGKTVQASLIVKFKSWSEWVAKVSMDPFAVVGAERFTFYPTGKGIFYDHSEKETPKEVSLTYEYVFGTPPPPEMKEEEKKKLTKATKEWKGFYWDELTVFLSDEISNTFTDEEKPKDSMVVYKYGLNNTVVDSVHYSYPGSRINFGAKGLIIDKFGFTADFFARDILNASTKEGWGWTFSLDTVYLRFTKSQYKEGIIKGGFGVPLFKGGFLYDCSIGADSLMFNVQPRKDTLDMDIWLASVLFKKESSYFRIKKIYKESNTRIDLTLNGYITLKTSKLGLPSDFSLVKFERMGMRNYNLANPKAGTASADGFQFDVGEWAFASPQKYIGGSIDEEDYVQKTDGAGSVSFCGFTFSLKKIEPIAESIGEDLKIGVQVVGQMKFATEGTDLGATTGFTLYGITEPKNKFHIKKVDAQLDKIKLDNIDFEVFKMSGELDFKHSGTSGKDVTGFGGNLSITVMNEVTLTMGAGFGKEKDNQGNYSWWYFDGACKFPGIPIGPVSITGFSGGFAYNMKSKYSLSDARFSAKNLLAKAAENENQDKMLSSGMDFEPKRDCWVANAGISLILTGAKNTLNADGLVSLRIVNKHFSGLFIDANAYVLTNMNEDAIPGDGSNNKSPLLRAKAIMGYETIDKYDYFRLSIAVKASISLSKLLDGMSSTVLGSQMTAAIHAGTSLVTSSNIDNELTKLVGDENGQGADPTGISSHGEKERNQAANASSGSSGSFSFNTDVLVPIDFELKHYRKSYEGHKKGTTDWYFAIGKPKYEERVQLSTTLNMVVCSASADFTFYMQTGNAFAYEMPPLSKELQDFFGLSNGNKKLDANSTQVKNSRKIASDDWLKIDKGGGFCLGSTFHADVNLDFFLYIDVTTDLGFDVALLNVNGVGCPGHEQIGKHDFYALGRIYAALQGDVGLKLNLGFWKGKFSLFKAGVGALLQGGGPNPSYCYGMLRFKVNLLNGLLKFSTSCDFKLGDVCVPGAGDPLANVKLFENVTPGYDSEKNANNKNNLQSPLQIGTIVSNMPWDRDVLLCDQDGKNARKFRFVLIQNNCRIASKSGSQFVNATGNGRLRFSPSNSDDNVYLFETEAGGFEQGSMQKLTLQARGFEYRKSLQGTKDLLRVTNDKNKDVYYNISTGAPTTSYSTSYCSWYDPTFYDEKTKKTIVKPFKKDTTLYFQTRSLGEDLNDGVVFSWPYNGEPNFPTLEYVHSNDGTPYCNLYLFTKYDNLFDKQKLESQGKQLKIYLLKNGLEEGEIAECSYTYYPNTTVPYVQVKLPKKEYSQETGKGPHMLKFLLVDKSAYDNAMAAAQQAAEITRKQSEYSSRITDQTYQEAEAAHNRKTGKGGSLSSGGAFVAGGSYGGSSSSGGMFVGGSAASVGGTYVASGTITGLVGSSAFTSSSSGGVAYATGSTITGVSTSSSSGKVANTSGMLVAQSSSTGYTILSTGSSSVSSSLGKRTLQTTSSSGSLSLAGRGVQAASNSGTTTISGKRVASTAATVASFSNAGTLLTLSGNNKLNIQDEMLDEIYENKQDVGKDSMTYIRTMLKEGYKISAGIGKQIYKWTWHASGSTLEKRLTSRVYGAGAASIYQKDLADELSTARVDYWTEKKCVYLYGENRDYHPGVFDWYAWLFLPYNPEDVSFYHTNCEMPPVCYLVLDRKYGELVNLHREYFQRFVDMESDFKKTELLTVFKCRVKDGKLKYDANDTYASGGHATDLRNILKGGFYLNNSVKFPRVDRRIMGGTDFTQCTASNYHPTTVDVPCILDFDHGYGYGSQVRKPLDEKFFDVAYANQSPMLKCDDGKYSWGWKIKDFATEAIAKDLDMFSTFMYENQMHAQSLNKRDWGGKRSLFNLYYSESYRNAYMTYSNFPFDMPMIYRVVHYMRVLQDMEPNTSYRASTGEYYKIINADQEYMPIAYLQLQDRYWAKYWWSSNGQSTNVAKNGFDRDFYFYNENTKYYDLTCDQDYNGKKHNCYSSQSSMLGSWYKPVDGTYYGMYNPVRKPFTMRVKLYFLSSQGPDFAAKLMSIAQAVKRSSVQSTKVFYPNKILDTSGRPLEYTIPSELKFSDGIYKRLTGAYNKLNNFRSYDTYGD
ncbi:MAG: hypothetical protein IJK85_09610 [Bacteroidales bacterium]|nr:hypothetical protein [Bacteroidales bacterium]